MRAEGATAVMFVIIQSGSPILLVARLRFRLTVPATISPATKSAISATACHLDCDSTFARRSAPMGAWC
jgi:hypothetical protein